MKLAAMGGGSGNDRTHDVIDCIVGKKDAGGPMSPLAKALLQTLSGIALLFVFWGLAAAQSSALLVPNPLTAVGKAIALLTSGEFIAHGGRSFAILLAGFGPAVLIAIAVAHAAHESSSSALEAFVRPFAAMPLIILMPAIVLWMGLGWLGNAVLVFLVTLFPMLDSIMTASKAGRPAAAGDTVTAVAASRSDRRTATVVLAASRLGLMLGVGAVVADEMFASREGIGYLLMSYAALFDTAALMATLMIVLIPTALAGSILQGFEDQLVG